MCRQSVAMRSSSARRSPEAALAAADFAASPCAAMNALMPSNVMNNASYHGSHSGRAWVFRSRQCETIWRTPSMPISMNRS